MFERWGAAIERDPYYNPNLSRLDTDFRPRTRIDEHPFFYYTPAGFRAHPPGMAGGEVHTSLGIEGPQAPSPGILAEICVSQEQTIDRLETSRYETRVSTYHREMVAWFAGPALFLLIAAYLVESVWLRRLP